MLKWNFPDLDLILSIFQACQKKTLFLRHKGGKNILLRRALNSHKQIVVFNLTVQKILFLKNSNHPECDRQSHFEDRTFADDTGENLSFSISPIPPDTQ